MSAHVDAEYGRSVGVDVAAAVRRVDKGSE